jgi:4-hydroxy-tetrahydrodipicolinate reductase
MTKIFLFGKSGKMGKEISALIADDKKTQLVEKIEKSDVVIDFTNQEVFSTNLEAAVKNKKAFVSGTTGLNEKQFQMLKKASEKIPVLWASNMSIGICVVNQMIKTLKSVSDYDFYIEETHHAQKKDSPSGTALTIQKNLEKSIGKKVKDMISIRGGGVFGQHKIVALGPEEKISIQHDALNRTVFARGALSCSKWISNKKPGNYSIEDVLK